MVIHERDPNKAWESPRLPPGFRFHPTDEELVGFYLTQKVLNSNLVFQAIGEVDFNRCEPWDLPAKAKVGHQSAFYFFSLRDRKYPTGLRTNRATEAGYWKATGKDREVMPKNASRVLGMKKTLVFYKGRAPKGEKTNWIMHEYRLEGEFKPEQQEWVVCRAFEKMKSSKTTPPESCNAGHDRECTTNQPCSIEPTRPDLKPFSSNSLKSNTSFEPQGMPQGSFEDASFSGHGKIFSRSDSSMKVRRELGDTLETLLSGWDMGSPIWDDSIEHQLVP